MKTAKKRLFFQGLSVVVDHWHGEPQTERALGRLVRKAIEKAALNVEMLHGTWCGPDWRAAEVLDREVRNCATETP